MAKRPAAPVNVRIADTDTRGKWYVRLGQSMALSAAIVFTPVALLLIINAFASASFLAFGGR